MDILDRALLCGLGLSADSANILMDHIEELREEIKRLKRDSPNDQADRSAPEAGVERKETNE